MARFQSSSWFPHISRLGAFLHPGLCTEGGSSVPSPEALQAVLASRCPLPRMAPEVQRSGDEMRFCLCPSDSSFLRA